MADLQIDADVRDVLSRAECAGIALRLPQEQLDRKLYERVDQALRNAGGKWDRKSRAHIFPVDAQPKLIAMLGSGVSVDEKKRDQAFFTPPELARQVARLADVSGRYVLEPSAGRGAIADACIAEGALMISCFELNPEYAEELRHKPYSAEITEGDFLDHLPAPGFQFLRIVMNPPFTKNQDIKHVSHALKWLAPGGILVSLMMPNQNRKGFQEIVDEYDSKIIEVERGAFKESGTDIATIIVRIQK